MDAAEALGSGTTSFPAPAPAKVGDAGAAADEDGATGVTIDDEAVPVGVEATEAVEEGEAEAEDESLSESTSCAALGSIRFKSAQQSVW